MYKLIAGITLVCLVVLAIALFKPEFTSKVSTADDSQATLEGIAALVRANNQFAIDVYAKIAADGNNNNVFFSPYSISSALAMTYEGARGATAEEMQSVFYFPDVKTEHRAAAAAIYNKLNAAQADYTLRTANALWVENDYQLLETYTEPVTKYYAGNVRNLDFATAADESRKTINTWVADNTEDKIKDLIPPGMVTAATRLVLTNAIYFKGDWETQFDELLTRDQDFRVNSEKTVQVPMMRLTGDEAEFNYAETDSVQVLELPYQGDELSMLLLLPKEGGLSQLHAELSSEQLSGWREDLSRQRVDVFLPRFTFEHKQALNQPLIELGMPTAFSPGADFSGMTGGRDLYIGAVVHQAFIEVNEEGSEAAAATAVGMRQVSAAINPVFRADHPFMFMIQDKETGNILFMGAVNNPVE